MSRQTSPHARTAVAPGRRPKRSGVPRISAALFLILALWASVAQTQPLGLPPLPAAPDNPQTDAKIRLGDRLFHDSRFSSTGDIGCQSCHLDVIAFQDGRVTPKGVRGVRGTRNAPTVINAAYYSTLFWDGRAGSLEEQALQPLVNPVEQGLHDLGEALLKIRRDPAYVGMFREAFGVDAQGITMQHFAQAIAAFERTLVFGNSPFDRWHFGGQQNAMSAAAKRGYGLFTGRGGCSTCHTIARDYALFTDGAFHNVNVGFSRLGPDVMAAAGAGRPDGGEILDHAVLTDREKSELGRYAVTGHREDLGAFVTPGLRNVAMTPPYFHDGSLKTLEQVVRYFNNGGRLHPGDTGPNSLQSSLIRPLHLSQSEQADLVAFLESLTSPEVEALRARY